MWACMQRWGVAWIKVTARNTCRFVECVLVVNPAENRRFSK